MKNSKSPKGKLWDTNDVRCQHTKKSRLIIGNPKKESIKSVTSPRVETIYSDHNRLNSDGVKNKIERHKTLKAARKNERRSNDN